MDCQKHVVRITAGLRQKKIKVTPVRLLLLDVFEHAREPLSASEVTLALGKQGTNQSTVYRNLESLAELGLLKRLSLRSRQAYYELSDSFSSKSHHHHLICSHCSKIVEIIDCQVRPPSLATVKQVGFTAITDHSLEFFGLCSACSRHKSLKL